MRSVASQSPHCPARSFSVFYARVGLRLRGFLSCPDADCGWQGWGFSPLSEHRPWLVHVVWNCGIAPVPLPAEVSLHSTLPETAYLVCPATEVSPMVLAQGTIHSSRLLIKTMCSVAGPAGGSSGNQAWPGACDYKRWEWGGREGAGDPQACQDCALEQDWNSYPNLTHTKSTLSQALGFGLGCGR